MDLPGAAKKPLANPKIASFDLSRSYSLVVAHKKSTQWLAG